MIIISYNNVCKGLRKPNAKRDKREIMPMRKTLLAPLLAAAVTALFAQDVSAQEKNYELKLSHWVPASHPLQKALEDWSTAVEKESGGTIKSKVFPAKQLG